MLDTCSYGFVTNGSTCIPCSNGEVTPNIRIVGGSKALINSWPSQVFVLMNYKLDYGLNTISDNFMCGGTLINQNVVLTAAHCLVTELQYGLNTFNIIPNKYYPTLESMFTVYAGVNDISFLDTNSLPSSPGIKIGVSKVVIHKSYDSKTYLNDIMLLILEEKVELNSAIKVACLPKDVSSTYPSPNQYSYASGWGKLSENSLSSNILYNVRLNIYDPSYCSNVFSQSQKNFDSQICSGEFNGGKDTCQGDSGGGLYIFDSSVNKFIVVGVTSFGVGCGRIGNPGIYTRVSYYKEWIYANWNNPLVTTVTTSKITKTETTKINLILTESTKNSTTISKSQSTSSISSTNSIAQSTSSISSTNSISQSTSSISSTMSKSQSTSSISSTISKSQVTISTTTKNFSSFIIQSKLTLFLCLLLNKIF